MKMFSRRLLLILAGFSLYACQSTPAEQTGGESTEIVKLTYEELRDFHKK